jgi:hypothetical protein
MCLNAHRMTESDARQILLVRAFETPLTPPWSEADATEATREARRRCGEAASDEDWLAQRAQTAASRLAERESAVARVLAGLRGHAALRWLPVLLALAAGVASDLVGAAGRINILAPPLLALLTWNLGVYALLALGVLRPSSGTGIASHLERWIGERAGRAAGASARSALQRFLGDWLLVARPLIGARTAAMLHAAAAALAAGALASLYLRGLAFEYRAGWDSTFLDPAAVHRLLTIALGPAAQIGGIGLPGADELARLRFAAGSGENAARWIHLYAITLGLVVLLPRGVLALAAAWRARRLAGALRLPVADPYFARLAGVRAGRPLATLVVPCSYHVDAGARASLASALESELGGAVELTLSDPVPSGDEDSYELPATTPQSVVVALFALTATPEAETHGRLLQRLLGLPAAQRLVLIDESAFRARFDAARLEQRRDAWRKLLDVLGARAVFVDLAHAGVRA